MTPTDTTLSNGMDEYMQLLHTKEELCSELVPYLELGGDFDKLRHPLIYMVPYAAEMNAVLNRQFKFKFDRVAELKDKGDYHGYIFFHERPYRLEAFIGIRHHLDDQTYWRLVNGLWTDCENIWQNKSVWTKVLSDKDRFANRHMFMESEDQEHFDQLFKNTDVITVMRGCKQHNKSGYSWTTHRHTAEMFAKRWARSKDSKLILTGQVNKKHVIAYTNSRDEHEIIVPSRCVKDIKIEVLTK